MVGRAILFFVMCAGLLLMSCNKNPASGGGAPVITTQPANLAVNEGQSASFTVVATGDPAPTYQWQKNGNDIVGATGATYTIASTTVANSGTYRVIVTNSAGSVTSSNATLTVTPINLAAPTIYTQPASLTVDEGSSATFTVVATGNPAPQYQWRKNGVNIPGATSVTYGISSATQTDAAIYTVYVWNSQGNATSNDALLIVNRGPETLTYTVLGDSITITMPQQIYANTYCNGNTLAIRYDTSLGWIQTMWFNVSVNTLSLDQGGNIATLTRVGSGTGLIGTWTPDIPGSDMPDTLIFDATTITVYGTGGNSCPADNYLQYRWYWDTSSQNGNLNGTIVELSCTQVRITGNVTGEQVTITWASNGDMTYTSTSTNPVRTPHTWYENPTSCPNNDSPDWWWTQYPDNSGFMNQNQKASTAAKRAAVGPSVPVMKRHSRSGLFG